MVLNQLKKIKIKDNTYFIYSNFKIDTYSFEIIDEKSFAFGCTKLPISKLKPFLNRIKGEPAETEVYMISENGNKLFKKEDILEESKNYYIVGSTVFEKSLVHGEKEFIKHLQFLNRRDVYCYGKNIWCYNGHPLGKTDDIVIKRLEYILNVLDKYKEAVEL